MADLALDILIEDPAWRAAIPALEGCVSRAVQAAAEAVIAHRPAADFPAEVAVILHSDAGVASLNAEWRGKQGPTNVLSFPAIDDMTQAAALARATGQRPSWGDVVLAFGVVQREAAEQQKSIADHLCHLLVHGVLHLAGYDHIDEAEAAEMEGLEVAVLKGLDIADPYAPFSDSQDHDQ